MTYEVGDLVSLPKMSTDGIYRVVRVIDNQEFKSEFNSVVAGGPPSQMIYKIERVYGDRLDHIESADRTLIVPESWLDSPDNALVALALQAEDD